MKSIYASDSIAVPRVGRPDLRARLARYGVLENVGFLAFVGIICEHRRYSDRNVSKLVSGIKVPSNAVSNTALCGLAAKLIKQLVPVLHPHLRRPHTVRDVEQLAVAINARFAVQRADREREHLTVLTPSTAPSHPASPSCQIPR